MERIIDQIVSDKTTYEVEIMYVDDDKQENSLFVREFHNREKCIELIDKLLVKTAKIIKMQINDFIFYIEICVDLQKILLE